LDGASPVAAILSLLDSPSVGVDGFLEFSSRKGGAPGATMVILILSICGQAISWGTEDAEAVHVGLPRDLFSDAAESGERGRTSGILEAREIARREGTPWIPQRVCPGSSFSPAWPGISDPWAQEKQPGESAPQQEGAPLEPPHSSWSGAANHFSCTAWEKYVWEDYLTEPAALLPVGLGVSAAIISHWDKTLARKWQGLLGGHETLSNIGQSTLIAGVLVIGTFFPGDGRNWWDEWWTIGEAFAGAAATDYLLKSLVKRPRPGDTPGTGIGTHSFPSGHATTAFTAATLIERNSGLAVGLPAYAVAAFTGFERVEAGRHYPSDVLAGAAIGTLFASVSDHLHWASGPGKGGIARPPVEAGFSFEDRMRGFDLSLLVRF
jgi:membrane-associated phospholipid phosphatase